MVDVAIFIEVAMDGFDAMPATFSPLERGDTGVRSFARNKVGNATIVTVEDCRVQIYVTRSAPGSTLFCLCVMVDKAAPVLLASGERDDMLRLRDATLDHFIPRFADADGPTWCNAMTPVQRIRCERGMRLVLQRLRTADPRVGSMRSEAPNPFDSPAARRLAAAAIAQAKAPPAPPIRVKSDGLALPEGEADIDPTPIEEVLASHPYLRHAVPAPDVEPQPDASANVPGRVLRIRIGIGPEQDGEAGGTSGPAAVDVVTRHLRRRRRARNMMGVLAACGMLLMGGGVYYAARRFIPGGGAIATGLAAATGAARAITTNTAGADAAHSGLVASLAAGVGVAPGSVGDTRGAERNATPTSTGVGPVGAGVDHGHADVADVPPGKTDAIKAAALPMPGGGNAKTKADFAKLGFDLQTGS